MAQDDIDMRTLNSQAPEESHGSGPESDVSPLISPAQPPDDFRTHLRLLFPGLWTVAFAVVLVIVVKVYEAKGVLTPSQKNAYNVVTTGLILFVGLSFYEAFKGLAKVLPPYLEHRFGPSTHDEREMMKGFDGLLNVCQLIWSTASWGLRAFCAVWLLINLIAAAIISLTFTLDDGRDHNGTYIQSGQVAVSNLKCYMHANTCSGFPVIGDSLAHAYGETTRGADATPNSDCGDFNDVTSIINSKQNFRYYCRRNTTVQEFGYRFNEYNPNDTAKAYPHFTKRVITASSGECNEYSLVDDPKNPKETIVGDDDMNLNYISARSYTYINGSTNGSIVIPTSALGKDGTTYIYTGFHTPANASIVGYGDRGIWMWAYRNPSSPLSDGQPGEPPMFYKCPITVGPVTNVSDSRHNITDDIARTAAASIALQGQFKGPINDANWMNWQWYANGHPWEIHDLHDQTNSRVGANMAEHAIVSLAEMVARNPPISTNGTVPYLGTELSVRWKYFEALMASIVAVNFLVIALSSLAIKFAP